MATEIRIRVEKSAAEIMALLVEAGGWYLEGMVALGANKAGEVQRASGHLFRISNEIKELEADGE